MRYFPVPMEMREEQKLVGGIMTVRQLIYLLLGLILGALTIGLPKILPLVLRIFLGMIVIGTGVSFAFMKADGTTLDIFLLRMARYFTRQKRFILKGDE